MKAPQRPFLGISFRCCSIYGRVYKDKAGTCYEGRCPRCGRKVRVLIGPHGTKQRFFVAYPRY